MVSMLDTGVRARYHKLKYWQEQGGVMLMGFEMFRNLALGTRLKQKSLQVSFKQYLLDPGNWVNVRGVGGCDLLYLCDTSRVF